MSPGGAHRAGPEPSPGRNLLRGVVPRAGLLPTLAAVLVLSAAAPTLTASAEVPTPAPAPAAERTAPGPAYVAPVSRPTSTVAAPARVTVPRAGISARLEQLHVDGDGRLEAPRAWQRAGWFADGVAPGQVGPAVLAGHVDSPSGPAAFTGLDRLRPGDEVLVEQVDGTTVRFVVDRLEQASKGAFPTDAVYGPTPDAQLRLITCDGPYVRDAGGYQDNLVVYATARPA